MERIPQYRYFRPDTGMVYSSDFPRRYISDLRQLGLFFNDLSNGILMQWIGQHDKHMNRIFECDIVKSISYSTRTGEQETDYYVVEWVDFGFIHDTLGMLEVVGNTCENPELLGKI